MKGKLDGRESLRRESIREILRKNLHATKEKIFEQLNKEEAYHGYSEEAAAAARKADAVYIWQYRGSLKHSAKHKKTAPQGVSAKRRLKAARNAAPIAAAQPLVVQVNLPETGMLLHVNDASGRRTANLFVTTNGIRHQPVSSKSQITSLPEMPWDGFRALAAFGSHMATLGRLEKSR